LVYVDDVNIMGGSKHSIKKNAVVLVVSGKRIGIQVNAEKTKYVVMSLDQNGVQNHVIKNDNKSIERVEVLKYLETS